MGNAHQMKISGANSDARSERRRETPSQRRRSNLAIGIKSESETAKSVRDSKAVFA